MPAPLALVGPDNTIARYSDDSRISLVEKVLKADGTTTDVPLQLRTGWRWLPFVTVDVAFDPVQEVKDNGTFVVTDKQVTLTYTKRAKTAAELAADKTADQDGAINAIPKAVYAYLFTLENRVRVLEGKSAVTATQFRAGLKALLP